MNEYVYSAMLNALAECDQGGNGSRHHPCCGIRDRVCRWCEIRLSNGRPCLSAARELTFDVLPECQHRMTPFISEKKSLEHDARTQVQREMSTMKLRRYISKGKRNNRPLIFQKYDAYDFARRKNDWSEHPAFDGLNAELLPEHSDPLMDELMMRTRSKRVVISFEW